MVNYLANAIRYQQEMEAATRPVTVNALMARKAAAMKQNAPAKNMLTQYAQKPADPLESFRSLAGLKDAYERRVQPIINNAAQTFSTGGPVGDLLRSYGEAAALGNAAALQGMGIPFKGPMTAPREEGFSSGENFRPMGDPQQQFAGQLLGDPMNVLPMVAPAARGAVAAGKYAGPELARGLENYMGRTGMQLSAVNTNSLPNSGRDLIRSKADELSNMLNQLGFQTDVKHSGSAAGPSSYINVYDPQTGRSITDPARISGHSKGAFNSQFVHDISDDPQSMQKFVDLAMEMRAKGPSEMMRQQPAAEQAAIEMRYKNAQKKIAKGKPLTKSEQEAIDLNAQENNFKNMELWHGSPESIPEVTNSGIFGGVFAHPERSVALSHADNLHKFNIPEEKILTQDALSNISKSEFMRLLSIKEKNKVDRLRELVVYGEFPNEADLKLLKSTDLGEASWEAQRLRGVIAKKQGFHAVAMPDEHGTSYLVLPPAKIIFRK